MPLFKLDIEKQYQGEFWTNRYVLEGADLPGLVPVANAIVDAERAVHFSFIIFTRYRLSDFDPDTDVYVIQPLDENGLIDAGGQPPLPLFNVARVDFSAGLGRPSRKYLRTGMTENAVNGSVFTTPILTGLQNYADFLPTLGAFVDVDGQDLITGVAFAQVAMRQLRRGSRRRTTPVLPPG